MHEPPDRMSRETADMLEGLTREDVETIKRALPLIRMVIGFGKVSMWLIAGILGLFFGLVMLWEAIQKVMGWFVAPPN
jgi:hypothetical protein